MHGLHIGNVNDVRETFGYLMEKGVYNIDKTGVKTLEILCANFFANEPQIFGKLSDSYLKQEMDWYLSQSLNIDNMADPVPELWKSTAGLDGETNSNYGWCVYSVKNYNQFTKVVFELKKNQHSRRAIMLYTRPTMHTDFEENGKNDFMCFSGDTIIKSPEGDLPIKKLIEQIEIKGKYPVYSVNFETKEREIKFAVKGFKNGIKSLIRVHFDNKTYVDCTEDHLFYARKSLKDDYKEVKAKDLVLRNSARLMNLSILELVEQNCKVLKIEKLSIQQEVFDIEVEDNHNYFVGEIGVLVHNCTNSVQYFIRPMVDGSGLKLFAYVQMRSNDAIFGYKCDYHWQDYVLKDLHSKLSETYPELEVGGIVWNVGSLHIYERHFKLVEKYINIGEWA